MKIGSRANVLKECSDSDKNILNRMRSPFEKLTKLLYIKKQSAFENERVKDKYSSLV